MDTNTTPEERKFSSQYLIKNMKPIYKWRRHIIKCFTQIDR